MDQNQAAIFDDRLLELSRHPLHMLVPGQFTDQLQAENALCGDQCILYLIREGETIRQVFFTGQSCTMVRASASVLTGLIRDYPVNSALYLAKTAIEFFRHPGQDVADLPEIFSVFSPLRQFPTRTKCLILPWQALSQLSLEGKK